MKWVSFVLVACLFITGCSSSKSEIKDNGHPGQIKAIVFYDANHNRIQDPGEPGLKDRVSLSQDFSCPATDSKKMTIVETDANGETVIGDLKPGHYCVAYSGDSTMTTKLTNEIDLSSEQTIQVIFGRMEKDASEN